MSIKTTTFSEESSIRTVSLLWQFLLTVAGSISLFVAAQAQEQVIATVSRFTHTVPIVHSSWPVELRNNAALYSSRSNVWDEAAGKTIYRLTMAPDFPWEWKSGAQNQRLDALPVLSPIDWDYLPPEADEVWIRLRVISGRFNLAMGCINLAFVPSDTFTDIRIVDSSVDGWQTVRFSLHQHLIRNFRRNEFTRRLPYIALTRWIQENLMLHVFRPSYGELLVDRVELVSRGLGQRFPTPNSDQLTHVATVADFESTNDLALAFTFSTVPIDLLGPQPTNYTKTSQFTSGRITVGGKAIQWYEPPRHSWVDESTNGLHSLEVRQTGYESFAFTGLRLPPSENVNGILLTVRADHSSSLTNLVLDFLAYAATPEARSAFPWTNSQPPAAWLENPTLSFDLFLSQTNAAKESYAMYHLRRVVPNHQWTQLYLPLEDFAGIYAANEGTNILRDFQPLQSTNLLFLGFFSPYRQLRAETRILLDDLSLVRAELPAGSARSYWQNPAIPQAQLIALSEYSNYFGHVRERDRPLGPISITLIAEENRLSMPVTGPPGQRYDILKSEDLRDWEAIRTGYVDSSEDPFTIDSVKGLQFFRVVSE